MPGWPLENRVQGRQNAAKNASLRSRQAAEFGVKPIACTGKGQREETTFPCVGALHPLSETVG
jgi:hypothetical protein